MIKSKAIRFAAEISKIQTMVDGGLRIILDTPESELPAISELMKAKKDGYILEVAAVAVKPQRKKKVNDESISW